ncbi:hypothetical protein CKO_04947 [Citrobacter koseri ATCC BAA-895]|uniref:Uncharacterized protein n=1 Tax=Citrobacter koseri (strain ATCC BAA-895 / CDC 4225-83 / SGSC4696) TaxID=290338 RepID=A8AR78_CITK8|nr:hypothetical protein CKO_04947 [Citrobacter koseri ATCC BAA-895]
MVNDGFEGVFFFAAQTILFVLRVSHEKPDTPFAILKIVNTTNPAAFSLTVARWSKTNFPATTCTLN